MYKMEAGLFGLVRAREPQAPRRASLRLDTEGLKLSSVRTLVRDRIILIENRDPSWAHPETCHAYWGRRRSEVLAKSHLFSDPRLLTLTIDRAHFDHDPERAYEHVRQGKYIARFVRMMGFKKAVCVLAFHPDAPQWPHWHLLVDAGDVPNRWIDLKKGWRLWRDEWRIGGFDVGLRQSKSPTKAVRYIFGYVQHQSFPVADWVLDRERLPRGYELYGELRKPLERSESIDSDDDDKSSPLPSDDPEPAPQGPRRTVRDRLEQIGNSSIAMLQTASGRWKFLGIVSARPGEILAAMYRGAWHGPLPDVGVRSPCEGYESVELSFDGDARDGPQLLERIQSAALDLLCERMAAVPF